MFLVPDLEVNNVWELTPALLEARGITLLLADLDNTLAPYGVAEPPEEVRSWAAALARAGIQLFVLSNSRRPGRAADFAGRLGVPFLGRAGKPKTGGFRRAMEQTGRTPGQTAMAGDQLFTDVWGANNAGVLAVAVRPMRIDNAFRALRYGVEKPFRALGRRKEQV